MGGLSRCGVPSVIYVFCVSKLNSEMHTRFQTKWCTAKLAALIGERRHSTNEWFFVNGMHIYGLDAFTYYNTAGGLTWKICIQAIQGRSRTLLNWYDRMCVHTCIYAWVKTFVRAHHMHVVGPHLHIYEVFVWELACIHEHITGLRECHLWKL